MKYSFLLVIAMAIIVAACGEEKQPEKTASTDAVATTAEPNLTLGESTFKTLCVACHGADGNLALNNAKKFSESVLTLDERVAIVTKGRAEKGMAAYEAILKPEEIRDVAAYTMTLTK